MPTYSERQSLALEFAVDVARMRRCLTATGKQIDDDDIVYAWADYSDSLCASWLMPPDSDHDLLAVLLKHLPPQRLVWQTVVQDAGDGSGDVIIVLPSDLLARAGWDDGCALEIVTTQPGMLILRRKG